MFDEFARLDQHHLEESRRFLWIDNPEVGGALDAAWDLLDTIRRAAGQYATDDADQQIINNLGNELGIHGDALAVVAQSDDPPDGIDASAHARLGAAWHRVYSRRMRGLLILYCHRQLAWALADMLRRHNTPASGALRVQAEAAALAYLMSRDPSLARRWFHVGPGKTGKEFFRDTQPDVNDVLARYALAGTYEAGSAASQHARVLGVVGSFSTRSFEERGRSVQEIQLGFHEGAEESDHMRFLHPLTLLRAQERVANLLLDAFPEIDDALVRQQHFPRFKARVDGLFEKFERTFPDFTRRAMSVRALSSDGGG